MATTTSQIRSVLTDLYDALVVRGGLAGVTVFRYAPSPRHLEGLSEWITLAMSITASQSFPFLSVDIKNEAADINGQIVLKDPDAGDESADKLQSRAEVLLGEIEAALQPDPMIGRTDTIAQLTSIEHSYGADDQGRWHQVAFTVSWTSRLISS